MKKLIKAVLLVALDGIVFLLGNRSAIMWQSQDTIFYERFLYIFSPAFVDSFFTFNKGSVLWGLFCTFILLAVLLASFGQRKNRRPGEEHGSAKWDSPSKVKPYQSSDRYGNIPLSKNVSLSLSNEGKDYKYHTNKNILAIGGSGSGKTRFFVKPNLLQMHSCYVVTDPKGTCLAEVGNALKDEYIIKCFNTVDLSRSMGYNPLEYAKTEEDILKLVDALMLNTTSPDSRSGEQFWQDAERLLYTAIIAYIMFDMPDERPKNFNTFLELFKTVQVTDGKEEQENEFDALFFKVREKKADSFACDCFEGFRKTTPKLASSIIVSACARLMPFYIPSLRKVFEKDEMELDKIGFKRTAHFLVVDDTDSTFDFMVGLFYSQMLTRTIRNADANGGKLDIHTRLIMDEAANIAQIRNLDKVTGQIRSREMSICLIYQNSEQLEALYAKHAKVIEGNFDTFLFLGSGEMGMAKLVSERIGDETVNYATQSETHGQHGAVSQGESITKRRLMTPEEVRAMPGDECIVFIKSLSPIKDKKYMLEKHPRFKDTADYDRKNLYIPQEASI